MSTADFDHSKQNLDNQLLHSPAINSHQFSGEFGRNKLKIQISKVNRPINLLELRQDISSNITFPSCKTMKEILVKTATNRGKSQTNRYRETTSRWTPGTQLTRSDRNGEDPSHSTGNLRIRYYVCWGMLSYWSDRSSWSVKKKIRNNIATTMRIFLIS